MSPLQSQSCKVGDDKVGVRLFRGPRRLSLQRAVQLAPLPGAAPAPHDCGLAAFLSEQYYGQLANVPEGAPNYWLKRLMPPFEFGLVSCNFS